MFKKKRKNSIEVDSSLVEVQYLAIVNGQWQWFPTRDALLTYVENYSQQNVIYSLNMQKIMIYNLENQNK